MAEEARQSFPITPNDAADFTPVVRKLWIGGAGDLAFVLDKDGDSEIITVTVAAGQILTGLKIRRVMATGTTATLIRGLY